jgi:hypothetical protein
MSDFKIIFIHGYTASSKTDWYPTIIPMLEKNDVDFVIPNLPGGKHPHSEEWLRLIDREFQKTMKPVVLVGHSLGTRAVLLYLDQYKRRVQNVILIAPLSNETKNAKRRNGEAYPDFFMYKIDTSKIKPLSHKWLIVHSKDDDSLDYEEHGLALSREMKIPLLTFSSRLHFSDASNAPYVFKILTSELRIKNIKWDYFACSSSARSSILEAQTGSLSSK